MVLLITGFIKIEMEWLGAVPAVTSWTLFLFVWKKRQILKVSLMLWLAHLFIISMMGTFAMIELDLQFASAASASFFLWPESMVDASFEGTSLILTIACVSLPFLLESLPCGTMSKALPSVLSIGSDSLFLQGALARSVQPPTVSLIP